MVQEADKNSDNIVEEGEHHDYRDYITKVRDVGCTITYAMWNSITDDAGRFGEHQVCAANKEESTCPAQCKWRGYPPACNSFDTDLTKCPADRCIVDTATHKCNEKPQDWCASMPAAECTPDKMCTFDQAANTCRRMSFEEAALGQWTEILTILNLPSTATKITKEQLNTYLLAKDPFKTTDWTPKIEAYQTATAGEFTKDEFLAISVFNHKAMTPDFETG